MTKKFSRWRFRRQHRHAVFVQINTPYGSKVISPSTGILLNNEMAGVLLTPSSMSMPDV